MVLTKIKLNWIRSKVFFCARNNNLFRLLPNRFEEKVYKFRNTFRRNKLSGKIYLNYENNNHDIRIYLCRISFKIT